MHCCSGDRWLLAAFLSRCFYTSSITRSIRRHYLRGAFVVGVCDRAQMLGYMPLSRLWSCVRGSTTLRAAPSSGAMTSTDALLDLAVIVDILLHTRGPAPRAPRSTAAAARLRLSCAVIALQAATSAASVYFIAEDAAKISSEGRGSALSSEKAEADALRHYWKDVLYINLFSQVCGCECARLAREPLTLAARGDLCFEHAACASWRLMRGSPS